MNTLQTYLLQLTLWTTLQAHRCYKCAKFVWSHPFAKQSRTKFCVACHRVYQRLTPIALFVYGWMSNILMRKQRQLTNENVVIAICGKKGSGKDTCAQLIRDCMWQLNGDFYKHRAFAKPLKDVVQLLTDCPTDKLHTHEGKESVFQPLKISASSSPSPLSSSSSPPASSSSPPTSSSSETYRDILKSVGKSVRRFLLPWIARQWQRETELWTKCCLPNKWVISDLRLFDELQWLKSLEKSQKVKVFVIRVESPRDGKVVDTDVTETSVNQFPQEEIHFRISNVCWDDDKKDLKRVCERICKCILDGVRSLREHSITLNE